MRILALYSIKGGVGKTAAAVNLAYLAAARGERTLLWDLDPQAAATYYFRVVASLPGGSKALLSSGAGVASGLEQAIKGTDFERLDLVPADFSLRKLDLLLDGAKGSRKHLRRLLEPLSAAYDIVLLDCAPSISIVSENVFRAADALLTPVIPTTLSARTLEQLLGFLARDRRLKDLPVLAFFSMVDRRKGLHLALRAQLAQRWPQLLMTDIPYAAEVERMGLRRMPLPAYAPLSPATVAFQALWGEIRQALDRMMQDQQRKSHDESTHS